MLAQAYIDKCSRKRGLVTYMSNNISLIDYKLHNTYPTWKGLSMDIIDDSGKIITIYNIYRSSKNNNSHALFYNFLQEFSPVIRNLSRSSKNVALTGNFNIDLLKFNSNIKCQECF